MVEAGQHHAHRRAIGGGHEANRAGGQIGLGEPRDQAFVNRARRMKALRAAAQDRSVARLETQSPRVGRHIGPALIDDADDAERHAHTRDLETVRPRPGRDHLADGIGQARDVIETFGHGLDALVVEGETVQQRRRELLGARFVHVAGIGGKKLFLPRTHDPRHGAQGPVLGRRVGMGHHPRGRARLVPEHVHGGVERIRLACGERSFGGHGAASVLLSGPLGLSLSTRSSRCTISSRPR